MHDMIYEYYHKNIETSKMSVGQTRHYVPDDRSVYHCPGRMCALQSNLGLIKPLNVTTNL